LPRGVLAWLRCSICGRSPAVERCPGLGEGEAVCAYCARALSWLGVCGSGRPRVRVARQVDVDDRLLESLRSRSSRRGRRGR